jgi:hypothetical protein
LPLTRRCDTTDEENFAGIGYQEDMAELPGQKDGSFDLPLLAIHVKQQQQPPPHMPECKNTLSGKKG